MHYVFYTEGNINNPFLTSSNDKINGVIKLNPEELIEGKIFRFKNLNYEIELTTPARNTSPYHMKSLLVKCKLLE